MLKLQDVFRLKDEYKGRKTTGFDVDPDTGAIIAYAINAAYKDGIYYSFQNGRPLGSGNYVKEIRNYIGKVPLQVPGTGVVVYRKRNGQIEVLLQERTDCLKYGLPGGAIELGESYQQCAVNELEQETALIADQKDLKLFNVYAGPKHITKYEGTGDIVYHSVIVYLLNYDKCEHANHKVDNTETKCLDWFIISELESLLNRQLVFPNNIPIIEDIIKAFDVKNAD